MDPKAILEKLKSMGRSSFQVQACMETYRDAGTVDRPKGQLSV
jgi:hypothetical protein